MADLTGVNDTLPVRVGGVSSTSGLPDNYADVNVGGSLQVAGQGIAGTPAGGVVSIQGVTGGTAVPSSQSGIWTTGRTWTLASGTDSVSAVQSGTWTTGRTWTLTSGTDSVSVIQSTSPWITKDQSDGPVSPGTVASFSQLIGGQFNTVLPTLTTGQQSAIQVDASARQIIAPLTNASVVKAQLQDNAGNGITSASNGAAGNQLLSVQTPDTTTATTALGALNANVIVAMAGLASVGFQILAGTLIGTVTPQCSLDGGTTWENCNFYNPTTSAITGNVVFSSANTLTILSILPIGGSSHVRVIVTAYTSGTGNALLRASQVTGAAGAVTAAAFGTVTNSYITLGTNTTTQLLTTNTNRKYAYISNNSGGTIAIQFGSATGLTSAARGLVIPNGNYYELKGDNLYTGSVYAYTNASGLVIAVTEGTP